MKIFTKILNNNKARKRIFTLFLIPVIVFIFGFVQVGMVEASVTEINYLQDLDNIRNSPALNYVLTRDLDFNDDNSYDQTDPNWATKKSNWTSGSGWTPLTGRHDYKLNGDGFEIKNLYVNRSGTHFQGLFGDVGNVDIRNIGVVNATVTGNTYNGILIGLIRYADGVVENTWSSGTLTSGANAGGLIGAHWGSTVTDSWSSATVNGGSPSGGLIGSNSANVYNSYATGNVTSSGTTGGLIGASGTGGVYQSFSTGIVVGGNYTGGLIGMKRTGVTVENSYSHSSVTGGSVVGGLIGDSGIVVDKSYSTGEITASGSLIGGLIGYIRSESINNSFWDTETSGYVTSAGGTGKTTAQMKNIGTFTNLSTEGLSSSWDMVLINNYANEDWFIDGGEDYPKLGWEFASPVATPNPPTNLSITPGNTEVVLTWTAPVNDGGSAITDYVVEYKTSVGAEWSIFATPVSTATSATVTGLSNGTSYDFRVSAVNAVGQGSPSEVETAIPITVPNAPTIGTATSGNAQASVTFIAPGSDGGSAITGYTVTSNPGGITASGASSPITVTGLTNGVEYTFTVIATNAAGNSDLSEASNSVTPATTPNAPTAVSATAGNAQISLTWSAPAFDGGSAITDYVIEYKLSTDAEWSIFADGVSTATNTTVTGLTNGSLYELRVSAVNAVGQGSPSNTASATPVTTPGFPTSVVAVRGNTEATISFNAPISDGGSAITGYTVTSNPGGITANGASSPINVTGLTNGTAYTFTVNATNAVGIGEASSPSNSITPATVPDAPTSPTVVPGNLEATVSFEAPINNGGSAITGYTVTSNPGGITASGASSPITVTGLTNGTAYTFTVTATNDVGEGDSSTESNSITPLTIPNAPTIGTATHGNAQVTVAFTPPDNNGGSAIIGYTVTSNPGGIVGTGSESPVIVMGLTNGTTYTFTVTATNAAGTGEASESSNSVTPATVPGAPTSPSAIAGNLEATVSFVSPVSDGGSAITNYTVTSNPGGITSSGASSPITVTGLTNGETYSFTVTATNAEGAGSSSSESNSVMLPVPPDSPVNLAATVQSQSVELTWSAPANNGGSAVTDYIVEYKLTTGGTWSIFADGVTVDTNATVTGLSNNTSYDFRVSAVNITGQGSPSDTASATPGEPAQVLIQSFPDLTVSSISTNVRITNEGLVGYEYQYVWCVTDSQDNVCGGGDDVFGSSAAKFIQPNEDWDTTLNSTVSTPGNYWFHLKVNYGSVSSSAYQSFTAVPTFPDAPSDVSAVAGNAEATVSFTTPAFDGGSAITSYTVTSSPGGITAASASSPITVTGLTNGTEYIFIVTATNAVGTGPASDPSESVIPATVPDQPTGLTATAGNGQVVLTWSTPANNGGSTITDYVVEYKLSNASEWSLFADPVSILTTAMVTGLTNGLSYNFRVSAVNAVGQSEVNSASETPTSGTTVPPFGGGRSGSGSIVQYPEAQIEEPKDEMPTAPVPSEQSDPPSVSEPTVISPTSPIKKAENEVTATPTEETKRTIFPKPKTVKEEDETSKEEGRGLPLLSILLFGLPLALLFTGGSYVLVLRYLNGRVRAKKN